MKENDTLISALKLQVEKLEKENATYKGEVAELIKLARNIIAVLGMMDETCKSIKPELISGQENVFPLLLGSISEIMGLITKSKMPIIGQKYQTELEQKFAFVKDIVPIIQKYATQA